MSAVRDIETEGIERDFGDAWGRVPHLTTAPSTPDGPYLLYVPSANGQWVVAACNTIKEAIEFVDELVAGTVEQPGASAVAARKENDAAG